MTPGVYGILVGVFVLVLTIFVFFVTGSVFAVFALWMLIALVVTVLIYYGFIDLSLPEEPAKPPPPAPVSTAAGGPQVGSEVFHIADSQFTYDEAHAVCAAYGAQLATLEQIIDAYNTGAEWCGYGWSAGGMALYPTQKSTWQELQREVDPGKRTACGRPGVNGGYFDPMTKFGVNCFGFKPKGEFTPPAPLPGIDQTQFKNAVNRFKEMIKSFNLSPWSRGAWSGYSSQNYGAQFKQELGKLTESFTEYANEFTEAPRANASYTAAPYGLKGETGPAGPIGPVGPKGPSGRNGPMGPAGLKGDMGPQGPAGPMGADSLVPGPPGLRGAAGTPGPEGRASTVPGPTGPVGPEGPIGPQGIPGAAAARGERGLSGPQGPIGPTGPIGKSGTPGVAGAPGPIGPKGDTGFVNALTIPRARNAPYKFTSAQIGNGVSGGFGLGDKGDTGLLCPANTVAVGLYGGAGGGKVDRVGLYCA